MLSHISKPTLSTQALCKIALKAGVCQEYSTSSCNFHNEKNNHCCHTMWLTKTLVKYVFCVSGLYSEEFQGAMLVQTCSKIFALNSPTSNCPGILDAKHKKVFCDRPQCQRLKGTSCNVGFFRTCKRTTFPPKNEWLRISEAQEAGSFQSSSQQSCIHTSQYSTLQSFPLGTVSKSMFDQRYALSLQTGLASGEFAGLGQVIIMFFCLLTDINSLFILPEFESAFDSCNYLRYRELKNPPRLWGPANTSETRLHCDSWCNFYHSLYMFPLFHKHLFKFPYSRHYSTSPYIGGQEKTSTQSKSVISKLRTMWTMMSPLCYYSHIQPQSV